MLEWCYLMKRGTDILGRPADQARNYPGWLTETGFVDVKTEHFKVPSNRWPKDPYLKELGAWQLQATDPSLEGLCMAVLTRAFDWSPERVLAFCVSVRKEMRNMRVHAYFEM